METHVKLMMLALVAMLLFFSYTVSKDDYKSPFKETQTKEVQTKGSNEGLGRALVDPTYKYTSFQGMLIDHAYSDD